MDNKIETILVLLIHCNRRNVWNIGFYRSILPVYEKQTIIYWYIDNVCTVFKVIII